MSATRNIKVKRGDDYVHEITFLGDDEVTPLDLSGYTFAAQIREDPDSTVVVATFTIDTSGAASGVLTLSLSKTATETFRFGVMVWDLETVTPDSLTETWLDGLVALSKDVTRP